MKIIHSFILLLIVVSGCEKSESVSRNVEEALSNNAWKLSSTQKTCRNDDFIELNSGGEYIYNIWSNKCDYDEYDIYGSWRYYIDSSINKLEIKYKTYYDNDTTEIYKITILTKDILKIENDNTSLQYYKYTKPDS